MKIRNGFVSNSSSSSFIAYKPHIDYKGMVNSINDLLSKNASVGDTYRSKVSENFYRWDGITWRVIDPNNLIKTLSMDYPNVKKTEINDFESNLKKLEETAVELESRERYGINQ